MEYRTSTIPSFRKVFAEVRARCFLTSGTPRGRRSGRVLGFSDSRKLQEPQALVGHGKQRWLSACSVFLMFLSRSLLGQSAQNRRPKGWKCATYSKWGVKKGAAPRMKGSPLGFPYFPAGGTMQSVERYASRARGLLVKESIGDPLFQPPNLLPIGPPLFSPLAETYFRGRNNRAPSQRAGR